MSESLKSSETSGCQDFTSGDHIRKGEFLEPSVVLENKPVNKPGTLQTSSDNKVPFDDTASVKSDCSIASSKKSGIPKYSKLPTAKPSSSELGLSQSPSKITRICSGHEKPSVPALNSSKNILEEVTEIGGRVPSKRLGSMDALWDSHCPRGLTEAGLNRYTSDHSILTEDTDSFIIGQKVWVGGTKPGKIAYIGETQFAPGEWAGIVLDYPIGKNDGSVAGIRYFQCEPKHGVFSRLTRLSSYPLPGADVGDTAYTFTPPSPINRGSSMSPTESHRSFRKSPSLNISSTSLSSPTQIDFKIGDRVIIKSSQGSKVGTLRYMGLTDFANGDWCGVELDEPRGKNDGSVEGKRYFTCRPLYGLFAPLAKVSKSPLKYKPGNCVIHTTAGLKKAGSRESLTSMNSSMISATSSRRVRLGVNSLNTQTRQKTPTSATLTNRTALQDVLREKQQHIEQLLKERDIERNEYSKVTGLAENVQQKLISLQSEYDKHRSECEQKLREFTGVISSLNADKNDLLSQLDDEKRKAEDTLFKFEEAAITKSDVEVENERNKTKIKELEELLRAEQLKVDNLEIDSQKLFETEEALVNTREELDNLLKEMKQLKDDQAADKVELLKKDDTIRNLETSLKQISETMGENEQKMLLTYEKKIKEQEKELEELKLKTEDKKINCERQKDEINILKEQLASANKLLEEKQQEIEEIKKNDEKIINNLKMELSSKLLDLETINETVKEQDMLLRKHKEELENMEAENRQLESQNQNEQDLKKELDNLRIEKEESDKEHLMKLSKKDYMLEETNKELEIKKNEIEKLTSELIELKQKAENEVGEINHRKKREIDEKDAAISALTIEFKKAREEADQSAITSSKLEEELCKKRSLLDQLEKELQGVKLQLQNHPDCAKQISGLQLENADLKSRTFMDQETIARLNQDKYRLEQEIQTILSSSGEHSVKLEQIMNEMLQKDRHLQQLESEYKGRLQECERTSNTLRIELHQIREESQRIKENFELQLQQAQQHQQVIKVGWDSVISENKTLKNELNSATTAAERNQLFINTIKQEFAENERQLKTELELVSNQLQKVSESCNSKISESEIETIQLKNEISAKSEQVAEIEMKLKVCQLEAEQRQEMMRKEFESLLQSKEFELQQTRATLSTLENELRLVKGDCTSTGVDLSEKNKQLAILNKELTDARLLIQKLELEKDELVVSVANTNQKLLSNSQQCANLLDQINELKNKANTADELSKELDLQQQNFGNFIKLLDLNEERKQQVIQELESASVGSGEAEKCKRIFFLAKNVAENLVDKNTKEINNLQMLLQKQQFITNEKEQELEKHRLQIDNLEQKLLQMQQASSFGEGISPNNLVSLVHDFQQHKAFTQQASIPPYNSNLFDSSQILVPLLKAKNITLKFYNNLSMSRKQIQDILDRIQFASATKNFDSILKNVNSYVNNKELHSNDQNLISNYLNNINSAMVNSQQSFNQQKGIINYLLSQIKIIQNNFNNLPAQCKLLNPFKTGNIFDIDRKLSDFYKVYLEKLNTVIADKKSQIRTLQNFAYKLYDSRVNPNSPFSFIKKYNNIFSNDDYICVPKPDCTSPFDYLQNNKSRSHCSSKPKKYFEFSVNSPLKNNCNCPLINLNNPGNKPYDFNNIGKPLLMKICSSLQSSPKTVFVPPKTPQNSANIKVVYVPVPKQSFGVQNESNLPSQFSPIVINRYPSRAHFIPNISTKNSCPSSNTVKNPVKIVYVPVEICNGRKYKPAQVHSGGVPSTDFDNHQNNLPNFLKWICPKPRVIVVPKIIFRKVPSVVQPNLWDNNMKCPITKTVYIPVPQKPFKFNGNVPDRGLQLLFNKLINRYGNNNANQPNKFAPIILNVHKCPDQNGFNPGSNTNFPDVIRPFRPKPGFIIPLNTHEGNNYGTNCEKKINIPICQDKTMKVVMPWENVPLHPSDVISKLNYPICFSKTTGTVELQNDNKNGRNQCTSNKIFVPVPVPVSKNPVPKFINSNKPEDCCDRSKLFKLMSQLQPNLKCPDSKIIYRDNPNCSKSPTQSLLNLWPPKENRPGSSTNPETTNKCPPTKSVLLPISRPPRVIVKYLPPTLETCENVVKTQKPTLLQKLFNWPLRPEHSMPNGLEPHCKPQKIITRIKPVYIPISKFPFVNLNKGNNPFKPSRADKPQDGKGIFPLFTNRCPQTKKIYIPVPDIKTTSGYGNGMPQTIPEIFKNIINLKDPKIPFIPGLSPNLGNNNNCPKPKTIFVPISRPPKVIIKQIPPNKKTCSDIFGKQNIPGSLFDVPNPFKPSSASFLNKIPILPGLSPTLGNNCKCPRPKTIFVPISRPQKVVIKQIPPNKGTCSKYFNTPHWNPFIKPFDWIFKKPTNSPSTFGNADKPGSMFNNLNPFKQIPGTYENYNNCINQTPKIKKIFIPIPIFTNKNKHNWLPSFGNMKICTPRKPIIKTIRIPFWPCRKPKVIPQKCDGYQPQKPGFISSLFPFINPNNKLPILGPISSLFHKKPFENNENPQESLPSTLLHLIKKILRLRGPHFLNSILSSVCPKQKPIFVPISSSLFKPHQSSNNRQPPFSYRPKITDIFKNIFDSRSPSLPNLFSSNLVKCPKPKTIFIPISRPPKIIIKQIPPNKKSCNEICEQSFSDKLRKPFPWNLMHHFNGPLNYLHKPSLPNIDDIQSFIRNPLNLHKFQQEKLNQCRNNRIFIPVPVCAIKKDSRLLPKLKDLFIRKPSNNIENTVPVPSFDPLNPFKFDCKINKPSGLFSSLFPFRKPKPSIVFVPVPKKVVQQPCLCNKYPSGKFLKNLIQHIKRKLFNNKFIDSPSWLSHLGNGNNCPKPKTIFLPISLPPKVIVKQIPPNKKLCSDIFKNSHWNPFNKPFYWIFGKHLTLPSIFGKPNIPGSLFNVPNPFRPSSGSFLNKVPILPGFPPTLGNNCKCPRLKTLFVPISKPQKVVIKQIPPNKGICSKFFRTPHWNPFIKPFDWLFKKPTNSPSAFGNTNKPGSMFNALNPFKQIPGTYENNNNCINQTPKIKKIFIPIPIFTNKNKHNWLPSFGNTKTCTPSKPIIKTIRIPFWPCRKPKVIPQKCDGYQPQKPGFISSLFPFINPNNKLPILGPISSLFHKKPFENNENPQESLPSTLLHLIKKILRLRGPHFLNSILSSVCPKQKPIFVPISSPLLKTYQSSNNRVPPFSHHPKITDVFKNVFHFTGPSLPNLYSGNLVKCPKPKAIFVPISRPPKIIIKQIPPNKKSCNELFKPSLFPSSLSKYYDDMPKLFGHKTAPNRYSENRDNNCANNREIIKKVYVPIPICKESDINRLPNSIRPAISLLSHKWSGSKPNSGTSPYIYPINQLNGNRHPSGIKLFTLLNMLKNKVPRPWNSPSKDSLVCNQPKVVYVPVSRPQKIVIPQVPLKNYYVPKGCSSAMSSCCQSIISNQKLIVDMLSKKCSTNSLSPVDSSVPVSPSGKGNELCSNSKIIYKLLPIMGPPITKIREVELPVSQKCPSQAVLIHRVPVPSPTNVIEKIKYITLPPKIITKEVLVPMVNAKKCPSPKILIQKVAFPMPGRTIIREIPVHYPPQIIIKEVPVVKPALVRDSDNFCSKNNNKILIKEVPVLQRPRTIIKEVPITMPPRIIMRPVLIKTSSCGIKGGSCSSSSKIGHFNSILNRVNRVENSLKFNQQIIEYQRVEMSKMEEEIIGLLKNIVSCSGSSNLNENSEKLKSYIGLSRFPKNYVSTKNQCIEKLRENERVIIDLENKLNVLKNQKGVDFIRNPLNWGSSYKPTFSTSNTDFKNYLNRKEHNVRFPRNSPQDIYTAAKHSTHTAEILPLITHFKQNGNEKLPQDKLIEQKNIAESQINFLNSIIVDMQKKNAEQKMKIEILESGYSPAAADEIQSLGLPKAKRPPRAYCDICEEFDLHETEECPLQSSEGHGKIDRRSPKKPASSRPYCEICEIFGHCTEDCKEDQTF